MSLEPGAAACRKLDRRRALIALGALTTAGCTTDRAANASGLRTVRVGLLRISPHLMAPRFYARFLPPGLAVETLAFNNSTEIKTAVVTGSIDFAVTGITAALQGASRGEPFRVLAGAADGASAIVARRDQGIERLEQLAGKRVGYDRRRGVALADAHPQRERRAPLSSKRSCAPKVWSSRISSMDTPRKRWPKGPARLEKLASRLT